MKHRPRPLEQDDLLRPRLVDLIDLRHELVKLAALIDWEVFDREWAGFFPSGKGRPATEPRLVAGLLYLQHAYRLSDEAVVARWVETPYYQHFTGETFFQHQPAHSTEDGHLFHAIVGTRSTASWAAIPCEGGQLGLTDGFMESGLG